MLKLPLWKTVEIRLNNQLYSNTNSSFKIDRQAYDTIYQHPNGRAAWELYVFLSDKHGHVIGKTFQINVKSLLKNYHFHFGEKAMHQAIKFLLELGYLTLVKNYSAGKSSRLFQLSYPFVWGSYPKTRKRGLYLSMLANSAIFFQILIFIFLGLAFSSNFLCYKNFLPTITSNTVTNTITCGCSCVQTFANAVLKLTKMNYITWVPPTIVPQLFQFNIFYEQPPTQHSFHIISMAFIQFHYSALEVRLKTPNVIGFSF